MMIKISQSNNRCCCNETPSTAGRNQDYFYPHFIRKLLSKKLCHAIYALDTKRNPVRTGSLFACYKYARFTQHTIVTNAYVADRKQLC